VSDSLDLKGQSHYKKNGVDYHRPLFKFKQIAKKSVKNPAGTLQQTKTTYLVPLISG
jgi:hypothetical protein